MRVIVAITGASGAIYARQTLQQLISADEVEQIALVVSEKGEQVVAFEKESLPSSEKIVRYANDDMFSPIASGSANWDAMIIVPASMGSIGRIVSGVSLSLIERAADVMLKERRRLIVVARETPYSLIHLRNMTTLTEAGAIVLPASPSFYAHPEGLEQATMTVVERIIAHAGIQMPHYSFSGK